MAHELCFKCGKKLKILETGPLDGVSFSTYGNYGSTVIDEFGDSAIQHRIYVCDECLVANSHLVKRFHYKPIEKERWEYQNTLKENIEVEKFFENQRHD